MKSFLKKNKICFFCSYTRTYQTRTSSSMKAKMKEKENLILHNQPLFLARHYLILKDSFQHLQKEYASHELDEFFSRTFIQKVSVLALKIKQYFSSYILGLNLKITLPIRPNKDPENDNFLFLIINPLPI